MSPGPLLTFSEHVAAVAQLGQSAWLWSRMSPVRIRSVAPASAHDLCTMNPVQPDAARKGRSRPFSKERECALLDSPAGR